MERIVVTGIGLVTPNGVGTDASFQSLINGRSGVGPITQFEATEQFSTRIAAEVKDFDPAAFMERKKIKEVSRFIPFAIAATRMALEQADLNLTEEERDQAGVYIGVGLGGLENLERCTRQLGAEAAPAHGGCNKHEANPAARSVLRGKGGADRFAVDLRKERHR